MSLLNKIFGVFQILVSILIFIQLLLYLFGTYEFPPLGIGLNAFLAGILFIRWGLESYYDE